MGGGVGDFKELARVSGPAEAKHPKDELEEETPNPLIHA